MKYKVTSLTILPYQKLFFWLLCHRIEDAGLEQNDSIISCSLFLVISNANMYLVNVCEDVSCICKSIRDKKESSLCKDLIFQFHATQHYDL